MLLRDTQALQPFTSPYLANYPEVSKEVSLWRSGFLGYRPGVSNRRRLQQKRHTRGYASRKNLTTSSIRRSKGMMSTANNETGARAIGADAEGEGRRLRQEIEGTGNLRPHATTAAGLADLIISGEAPLSFTMVQTNLTAARRDQRRAGCLGADGSRGGERRQRRSHCATRPILTRRCCSSISCSSPDGQKMYCGATLLRQRGEGIGISSDGTRKKV